MTSIPISFVSLSLDDYDRAKKILNKAKHPGFVGRELFHRCASRGQVCVAMQGDQDVGVAMIAANKLQALSVVVSAQGGGVGAALIDRLKPQWVSAIGDRVGWFEKRGYVAEGAARVGQNGKHSTQLMKRVGDPSPSVPPNTIAPTAPAKSGSRCRVCLHPDRLAIEADLLAEVPLRQIATARDMSKDVISRHKSHISPVRVGHAVATIARRIETGARSRDVLFAELHRDALDVFDLGKEEKNLEIMVKAIRERRELVALEFGTKSEVTHHKPPEGPKPPTEELAELDELERDLRARRAELKGDMQ